MRMSSLIPIKGEVEAREPPKDRATIANLLKIPQGRPAQYRTDGNGGTWWFWKTGRDLRKRNIRAKKWYKHNTPHSEYVYFEGPVLYLSAKETYSVLYSVLR